MVDAFFKLCKVNCFGKATPDADSNDSVFESADKTAAKLSDQKAINATSLDSNRKVRADNSTADVEYQNLLEMEPEVVLRRHNRQYLRSISTTSNDAMSSEEDDDETLDILSPLPRVSTHERSLTEEPNRQLLDKHNGTDTLPIANFPNSSLVMIPTKLNFFPSRLARR